VYSSNITPDKATGIGNYSLNDFDRAVRHGIAPSGETLYPAMPYPSYAKVTDDDLRALYAYFMHGVQPVAQANHGSGISWPLSMNWPLAIWRKTYAPAVAPLVLSKYQGDALARGAYLVQGVPVRRSGDRWLAGGQPAQQSGRWPGPLERAGHRRYAEQGTQCAFGGGRFADGRCGPAQHAGDVAGRPEGDCRVPEIADAGTG
jgi:hypothetical protein